MQETNWGLEILKMIVPGILAALATGLWLNNRTEKLKSELQRNLFEFETKFSLYHQRKADAVQDLYRRFAEMEATIREISEFTDFVEAFNAKMNDPNIEIIASQLTKKTRKRLRNLKIASEASSIYFESSIVTQINSLFSGFEDLANTNLALIKVKYGIENGFVGITILNHDDAMKKELFNRKLKANVKLEGLTPLRRSLEIEFRTLLSSSNDQPRPQNLKK